MPKKLVSKIVPSAQRLHHMRGWGFLGEKLFAHDLWHFNRKTVSYAFLNGIFWACMPIPFQMVGAAITALVLRCNVPVSVGLCWLTNPITMPPYFVIAYTVGAWILNSISFVARQHYACMDTRTASFDLVPVAHWLTSDWRLYGIIRPY